MTQIDDPEVGTGNIVGGHQRFKILRQLGYDEIDCVVVNLDEMREKALDVVLNKIRGEWAPKKLSELLEQLKKSGTVCCAATAGKKALCRA